ncbi:hypothetical protein ACR9GO_07160 [Kosakonia cowanii]
MKSFIFDTLKDLLPAISGLLGVLGVLNVFKKINGRLAVLGWLAITMIFLSTIGGIILAKKEKSDDEREKKELQQQLNNILADLAKVRRPLSEVELSFWSILPDSDPEVQKYKNYIKQQIKHREKDNIFSSPPKVNRDLSISVLDERGEPHIYDIDEKSKFRPGKDYPILRSLALSYNVSMCISLKEMKPQDFIPMVGGDEKMDWCAFSIMPTSNDIYYDAITDKVGFITRVAYKKDFTQSNGKISSVQDLLGSQVFFRLPAVGGDFLKEHLRRSGASEKTIMHQSQESSFLTGVNVKSLLLDVGNGQTFVINGGKLNKYTQRDGNVFFYIKLPSNEEELRQLSEE